jgi:hypothetical protein
VARAIGVLVVILAAQAMAIGVVTVACRHVSIRDNDSNLSVARLLSTTVQSTNLRSVGSGEELAEQIGQKRKMQYGTREKDGRVYVDLWDDVRGDGFQKERAYS